MRLIRGFQIESSNNSDISNDVNLDQNTLVLVRNLLIESYNKPEATILHLRAQRNQYIKETNSNLKKKNKNRTKSKRERKGGPTFIPIHKAYKPTGNYCHRDLLCMPTFF